MIAEVAAMVAADTEPRRAPKRLFLAPSAGPGPTSPAATRGGDPAWPDEHGSQRFDENPVVSICPHLVRVLTTPDGA